MTIPVMLVTSKMPLTSLMMAVEKSLPYRPKVTLPSSCPTRSVIFLRDTCLLLPVNDGMPNALKDLAVVLNAVLPAVTLKPSQDRLAVAIALQRQFPD